MEPSTEWSNTAIPNDKAVVKIDPNFYVAGIDITREN